MEYCPKVVERWKHTRVPVVLLFIAFAAASGGEKLPKEKYIASTIPDSLRKDAHAVVRHEELSFEVMSRRDARENIHRVVTVLDAEGRDFGEVVMYYDKFVRIDDFDMRVLDANGEEIRSLESSDVNDYAATSSYSLYEDSRVRYAKMYHSTYPYTIEYEITYDHNGYIGWPAWFPESRDAAVEFSQFRVTLPREIALRYWKNNTDEEPVATDEGGQRTYIWSASMLPQFEVEPVGPSSTDQYRCIRIAPAEFEIEGFNGDMSSWNGLGEWYTKLYQGRQQLPDRVHKEVVALVSGAKDATEKICLLYDRLQSTTRYVSVNLGVGGWQPFDATYVCQKGYGDCKALSNYMVSMLGAVGITAYPALVYGGTPRLNIDPNFPCKLFNHVIACVPLEKDTIWLECTSSNRPAGHLGSFTENRYALLITPQGGVLVKTPVSRCTENMQIRKATVTLSGAGSGVTEIHTTFTGNQQDRVRDALNLATPKEREEWLRENIEIPVFNVQHMDFSRVASKETTVGFGVKLQLPRLATVAGNRLLFQPNLMEKRTYVPETLEKRQFPIVHSYPYLDLDTVSYVLPQGYSVDAMPKPVSIETSFASYSSAVTQTEPGKLLYTRRLEISKTELPPGQYNEYRKFFQDVVQGDKASAALVKK